MKEKERLITELKLIRTMKKIITFILFISFTVCNAQSFELDKRNGFKTVKLGTDINQFQNIKILNKTNFKTTAIWTPSIDSDSGYLFEDKIDVFELTFNPENKLSIIKLSLFKNVKSNETTMVSKFKYINEKLISVLGKPKPMPKELLERLNNGTYINLKWSGEKVLMFLSFRVNDRYLDKNDNYVLTQSINLIFMEKGKTDYSKGF